MADEECVSPTSRRVPLPLQRLPVDHLKKLHEALQQIENAGLREIPDVEALKVTLEEKAGLGNAHIPTEDCTSEYMSNNLWAWTPSRWRESCDKTGASPPEITNPSWSAEEDNSTDELAEIFAKGKAAFQKKAKFESKTDMWHPWQRGGRAAFTQISRHFTRWFHSQLDAADEILALGKNKIPQSPEYSLEVRKKATECYDQFEDETPIPIPRTLEEKNKGLGLGVLFSFQEKAGPWIAPKKEKPVSKGCATFGGTSCVAPKQQSVVMVHIGSEGCALGAASLKRVMAEHGLQGSEGGPLSKDGAVGDFNVHFAETRKGGLMPRSIFVDHRNSLDMCSSFGCAPVDLFSDSAEGGYYEGFSSSTTDVVECLRRQLEMVDSIENVFLTSSLHADDFDSGFAPHCAMSFTEELGKKDLFTLSTTPPNDAAAIDAQKAMYSIGRGYLEYSTACAFVDVVAIRKTLSAKVNGLGLSNPGMQDCWDLCGGIIPSLTSGMRFGKLGELRHGSHWLPVKSFITNMVPYPRIKFLGVSCGPLIPAAMADFDPPGRESVAMKSVSAGYLSSFIGAADSKTLSLAVSARGLCFGEVVVPVGERKTQRDFAVVDWNCVTISCSHFMNTVKEGLTDTPEVYALHNTSGLKSSLEGWRDKLGEDITQWDGCEDMVEVQADISCLIRDYEEVAAETVEPDYGDDEEEY